MREGPDVTKGPASRPRPRTILVLTYWSHADALVQTYTLPYVRIMQEVLPPGSTIHLVTLEKSAPAGTWITEDGIHVHAFRYVPFGARAIGMVIRLVATCIGLILRHRVDVIHAWCTPAGMVGYLLSVITGRPLVIDSYEPHAEAMVENGTWRRGGLAFRILFRFERWQSHRARVLIAASEGMCRYAAEKYGVTGRTIHVKPACVDLERFSWKERKRQDLLDELGLHGKLVIVYAGKFGGIYLDREVFDLFKAAHDHWGDRLHVLLLTSHRPAELTPFIHAAGLDEGMFTLRFVPHAAIPGYMGLGDLAITPVRSVPTKRCCTPIKNGEYWALGLPVVITPDISDDSRIIAEHGIGAVLEGLGAPHYRKAVQVIDDMLKKQDMRALYERIRPVAVRYRNFDVARAIYHEVYGHGEA